MLVEKFENISYLREGNGRQRYCWSLLTENKVFEKLSAYDPVLAGTIPIGIDIDSSDLDIVCRAEDFDAFEADVERLFGNEAGFRKRRNEKKNAIICEFSLDGTLIELFGGRGDPRESAAFRHMIVEARILALGSNSFRSEIIALKESGVKTEPAFAKLLGLNGEPYEAMLKLTDLRDEQLKLLLSKSYL